MRNTAEYTVDAEGRDKGKTFLITEMFAEVGERWAMRALGILARSGGDAIPADPASLIGLMAGGWQALAAMGVRAALLGLNEEAFPLLDQMMECVQIKEAHATRPVIRGDINEVMTLLRLRDEVLRLHTNFSVIETLSTQAAVFREIIETSSNSPTSPVLSAQSSPFG